MHARISDVRKINLPPRLCLILRFRLGSILNSHFLGRPEIVRILVDNGADIHLKDNSGLTPLDLAKEGTRDGNFDYLHLK